MRRVVVRLSVPMRAPAAFDGAMLVADRDLKFPENVDGAYFVDGSCIDCDLCRITAPACFTANEDERHSYVFRQPLDPEEKALCEEALEHCPVEAIGRDGAEPAGDARAESLSSESLSSESMPSESLSSDRLESGARRASEG